LYKGLVSMPFHMPETRSGNLSRVCGSMGLPGGHMIARMLIFVLASTISCREVASERVCPPDVHEAKSSMKGAVGSMFPRQVSSHLNSVHCVQLCAPPPYPPP